MNKIEREGIEYTISDSKRNLFFQIAECDIDKAVPMKKTCCVVAQSLRDILPQLYRVEVGASNTYLFFKPERGKSYGEAVRYDTPQPLRDALNVFDRTGEWRLPTGDLYYLNPPSRPLGVTRPDNVKRLSRSETAVQMRNIRAKRAGKKSIKHINPRLVEFSITGS